MDYAQEALKRHLEWHGKMEVVPTCPLENKDDLSTAYTPGVAESSPPGTKRPLWDRPPRNCIRLFCPRLPVKSAA